jgi:glycosyltransferase involved in cell wall biosynthesis
LTPRCEPLISIVTPVYNGEKHLRECIHSVLAQTYSNWRFSIVNNRSTDGTLGIAQEYAARDSRISVVTNERFVGVMENYNNAVRQTSVDSAYCKVVAADDWLFPECLERMLGLFEANPGVGIVGAYQLCGTKVAWQGLPYTQSIISGRDACRMELMGGPYLFGSPTTIMYRADIVRTREVFFNEANLHSDTEACFEFLEHRDFGFVHQILTFGRVQQDSLTSYSKRYNTYTPSLLYLLLRYGPKYLTAEERSRRIDEVLRYHYHYLARQVYRRREPEFWRFHRTKLTELGYPLRPCRLARAVVAVAADLLLNPKHTAEWMLSSARLRRSSRTRGHEAVSGAAPSPDVHTVATGARSVQLGERAQEALRHRQVVALGSGERR